MSFKTIGIIVKPHTELVKDKLEHLLDYLKQKKCDVLLDESIEGLADSKDIIARDELGKRCDLAITLGGDGTILTLVALVFSLIFLPIKSILYSMIFYRVNTLRKNVFCSKPGLLEITKCYSLLMLSMMLLCMFAMLHA